MYDEDSGWMQSSDDLILRWDTVNIWRRNGKPSSQKQQQNFSISTEIVSSNPQTIDKLLENGIHWSGNGNVWRNRIVTTSTWRDEYPDWELQQFLSTHDGFREVVPAILYNDY